jgi:hypothetical protein
MSYMTHNPDKFRKNNGESTAFKIVGRYQNTGLISGLQEPGPTVLTSLTPIAISHPVPMGLFGVMPHMRANTPLTGPLLPAV